MDVAGLSMAMAQQRTGQAVGIAIAKKAMDTQQTEAQNLVAMLMNAAPSFGHGMDIRV